MLGVARQSVGIAVGDLADRGLVSYTRGQMRCSIAPASNVRHASATASFARSSIDCWGSPGPRPRPR